MKKKRTTKHADRRISERFGNIDTISLANGASHNGITLSDLDNYEKDTELPKLRGLLRRKGSQGKNVKLYRGYVFIFFRSSKRLITMYPLEEDTAEEYEKVKHIEDMKREKYRKERRE